MHGRQKLLCQTTTMLIFLVLVIAASLLCKPLSIDHRNSLHVPANKSYECHWLQSYASLKLVWLLIVINSSMLSPQTSAVSFLAQLYPSQSSSSSLASKSQASGSSVVFFPFGSDFTLVNLGSNSGFWV